MNLKKAILLMVLIHTPLNAQKLEFGKVTKQELEEKIHPIDTSANAAILFKKARTHFYYTDKKGFQCETTYEIKLKIYKKEGLIWANYSIPYYIGWSELDNDNVFFSDVVTYNLEDNKIEKTKLSAQGLFKEKINEYWMKKTITFPNVKVGSVIEFKYKLVSENIGRLPDFDFQETIPVNFAEYRSEIPVNYVYNTILRGYSSVEQESKDEIFTQSFTGEHNLTQQLSYTLRKQKYTLKNIPALIEEPYTDNVENYRIKIEKELSQIAFKDSPLKNYAQTWNDVAKSISKNEKFSKEFHARGYFEEIVKKSISSEESNLNKTKIIFNHVKSKIKWNGNFGYYPEIGVKEAYYKNVGNVADINLNLIIMLRSAGINASPVLISTRKNGKTVFPSREGFNYLIVSANIDNQQILMDATDPNSTFNILPIRCLNGTGRAINIIEQAEEIVVNPTNLSKSITFIQADLSSDGTFKGKVRLTKSDYNAFLFRDRYANTNKDFYLEKLEEDNNLIIAEYKLENEKELDKMIIETFSFSNANVSDISGDKIIFNPFLFYTNNVNPFKQDSRSMPIDFVFPKQDKYMINIAIPEGYQVEYLPKSVTITLTDKSVFLNFNISSDNDKITIQSVFDVNKSTFVPSDYADLKNIFKIYIEKQTESIILKKI
ncbi:MAG TPA: DUF3857 domain-containing protein [Flavobacterium sp.]|uniref:DUF3857 domain-containing protein n=1 Tax=unclassified Flavobacterium TaxID=196869 RepID=UPI0025C145AD|nr:MULTISPECIES: DUF3857 domain-containing protein [unclassified Flavobacterium]HRE77399.1 DUF3857 domain-containing protein [Flavobacterium sp.]